MKLLQKLIDPNPAKRFSNVDEAAEAARHFKDELVLARKAVHWVQDLKICMTEAKNAVG